MIPYTILERLPADAYLYPSMFTTDFDTPDSDKEQYAHGLEIGKEAEHVFITNRGNN